MGYRPEDQSLHDPIDNIVNGIDQLRSATIKRIDSGEWNQAHEDRLTRLMHQLHDIRLDLIRLQRDTW